MVKYYNIMFLNGNNCNIMLISFYKNRRRNLNEKTKEVMATY